MIEAKEGRIPTPLSCVCCQPVGGGRRDLSNILAERRESSLQVIEFLLFGECAFGTCEITSVVISCEFGRWTNLIKLKGLAPARCEIIFGCLDGL